MKKVRKQLEEIEQLKKDIIKFTYLIETKFIGTVTNKDLIKGLKATKLCKNYWASYNYGHAEEQIRDGDFENIGKEFEILKEFEDKQKVLDKYCKEKKQAKTTNKTKKGEE